MKISKDRPRPDGFYSWETKIVWDQILETPGALQSWIAIAQECRANPSPNAFAPWNDRIRITLVTRLQTSFESDQLPVTEGVYADLLAHTFKQVNWHEIARKLLERLETVENGSVRAFTITDTRHNVWCTVVARDEDHAYALACEEMGEPEAEHDYQIKLT